LGVLIQDVTRELAESFGMAKPQGALVAKVLSDSPASKAGFEVGDIVLSFDGRQVERSSDLPPIVGSTRVGTDVPVTILREGKTRELVVRTAELPEEAAVQASAVDKPGAARADKLGITVADLTAQQREENDAPEHGVLVTEVGEGPAKQAGIRTGDIVLLLDNTKVKDAETFKTLAGQLAAGKAISILVQRQGNPIFLALKPEN
jgi:serine protease Do